MIKIMIICHGNIYRYPMTEGSYAEKINKAEVF